MTHTPPQEAVVPAIIPQSLEHLRETLALVSPFTQSVQIDIVDGVFAPQASWPYTEDASLEHLQPIIQDFTVEVDLMVQNPEEVVEAYLRAGARRIVIHLESTKNLDRIVALKERYDFALGLSVLNDTDLHLLTDTLSVADYVQLMGIDRIGSQGESFDVRVLERVRVLKETHPHLEVSIDGSVNTESLPLLRQVGADRFVSGSAILGAESPKDAYAALVRLATDR